MSSLSKPTPAKAVPPGPATAARRLNRAQRLELLLSLALALATLAVYGPCFDHPFIHFDDVDYVTDNPHVQAGLNIDGVRYAFTTFDCGNWHPLTWLSLELDSTLHGGANAGGFHVTNVLLHTASAILLFLVFSRMTGLVLRSAIVAALFALHPLNVEPVAWVAERKGVLSTLFWMLTLAAYVYYVQRPSVRRYLLVALGLVLGLMAKPMLVTLPFVLLLLDYWPLKRWQIAKRSAILEKLPLFAVILAWSGIAFLTQSHVKALPSLEAYPLDIRVWNALLAYVSYLGKLFWPSHLSLYYPHPGAGVPVGLALGAGLLLAAITALVHWTGRRWPYLAVGWLWYLGTMVPMIGLVQIGSHGMADRYTYVPLIGLYLLLTWGAADLMLALRVPRRYIIGIPALALAACAVLAWAQLGYWVSDEELWKHALAVTEQNAMAHNNLGMDYFRKGQSVLAQEEFAKAVGIDGELPLYHYNLAKSLRDLGNLDKAVAECRKAIALNSQDAVPHATLGDLLRERGEEEEAITEYQKAIDLDSTYVFPHIGLGNVFADRGQWSKAAAAFRRAAELAPGKGLIHFNLGMALQAEGQLDEAMAQYRQAQELGAGEAVPLLRVCTQLRALRARLPKFLAGNDPPANNAERLGFADLCAQPFEGRYVLAVRLYTEVFVAEPSLAEDLRFTKRTDAAIAAAQAGCGRGKDAAGLEEKEKAQLRRQALAWLQADLALLALWAPSNIPEARAAVEQKLRLWQRDPGLAAVRDPAALAKLPAAERETWRKLWQDVTAVVARAMTKPP